MRTRSATSSEQVAAKTLYEHDAAVWCLAATSDQKILASLDYRGNLGLMDVATGESQMHEKAGERWCQCLTVSPDDDAWVFGNEAGKLFVWSIESNKQAKSIEVGDEALTSLSFSPDGKWLAVGSGAGQVRVFSWPELKEQNKVAVGEGPVWSLLFYSDDSIIAGSNDRHAYSIPVDTSGKLAPPSVLLKAGDWVTKLIPLGSDVYAGEVSGKVHRMRLGGSDPMEAPSGVWALAVGSRGNVIAGTRRDGVTNLTAVAKPAETVVEKPADDKPADETGKSAEEDSKKDESDGSEEKGK